MHYTVVKLGNEHKEALSTLEEISRKVPPPPPEVPLRVPIREVGQKKLQEVNQEITQMKKDTAIKAIDQCRTSEGAYYIGIPR